MNEWRRFGEEISHVEDAILAKMDAVDLARADFLEQAELLNARGAPKRIARPASFRRAAFALAAAASVVLAIAAGIGFGGFSGPAVEGAVLNAVIGDSEKPIPVGTWISAPTERERRIDFSDGSSVALFPGAGARVVSLEERGAHVFLEHGEARVSVHKREGTRWQVDVGPYTVSVKGTRFVVGWEPVRQRFSLSLEEGSVLVRGPLLEDGRLVATSETMHAFVAEGRLEIASNSGTSHGVTEAPSKEASGSSPESAGSSYAFAAASALQCAPERASAIGTPTRSRENRRESTATSGIESSRDSAGGGWRALASAGRHKAALASAAEEGFDTIISTSSAADLLLLGDSARLGRNLSLADRCYRSIRKRFPGGSEAANAAFALGKLDFDHRRKYADAAQWMTVYLEESAPGAVLAREALGRLIEAADKAGETTRAKNAAARYLASYPNGPHAGLARSVLENGNAGAPSSP